jgi:glucoselysine-6-phosphate deglycase
MYQYYLGQPACMKRILNERKTLFSAFGRFFADRKPARIYLIGSGSSLNACRAAQAFMEYVLGIEVTVGAPSNPPTIRAERPMILAVSQGGKSTNTVAYLNAQRDKSYPVVAFTAELDVPVAKAADLAVDIGVGIETVGPKTQGYTGTVLALYLCALEGALQAGIIGETRYDCEIALLDETIGYGEENIARCGAFYKKHMQSLKQARRYLFVGKGCAGAVGDEDALKVLETLCYPGSGYEFEEYLHGPACCTDEGTALFLFYSDDADGSRMRKLADITSKATPNCFIIDKTDSVSGGDVLNLKASDSKYASPFCDIFPGQLISALLTQELRRERHPAVREIFSDMETKVKATSPAVPEKG